MNRWRGIFNVVLLVLATAFFSSFPTFTASAGSAPAPPVPKTAADDPSIPHVRLNGAVFHAETFGDPANPVVIVVHGGPGWDYRSLLPLKGLSDEYFVVFYDQRGTGLSPRVASGELTLDTTLSDLDAVVDYYSKGREVRLIGHSWGGMLASAYIGMKPEKVSHAVLAEPGFLTDELMKQAGVRLGPRWEAGFLYRASKAWVRSLFMKGPDKDASSDYFIGQVAPYANTEYYCNGVLPEAAVVYWRPGSTAMQAIMKSAMNARGEFEVDLKRGVERFEKPVLFIASECNTLIGREHQARQMKFFPKAELVVISGSGHMMFAEKPEESLTVLRDYLKR